MAEWFQNGEQQINAALQREAEGRFEAGAAFWQAALFHAPWGLAALDAVTGDTLWLNAALQTMLQEGAGHYNVEGQSPPHYLPGLHQADWQQAVRRLSEGEAEAPRRLQFPHESSRSITVWEWSLQATGDRRYTLLIAHNVTDIVFNERMLATAGSTAIQARQRAEALVQLNRIVSESATVTDLLRAIIEETAKTFDSSHAAIFLRDGEAFRIGYSMGLADAEANAEFLRHPGKTLAMQALTERQALTISDTANTRLRLPMLENGAKPASLIVAPIQQGEKMYGAVAVYFETPRVAPPEEVSLLAAFASQVGLALQKADLFEQIAAQRRQLQSIFDNAPVSIVLFDTDFRLVAINQTAITHYWGKEESPVGRPYEEVFHDIPPDLFPSVKRGQRFHASHYLYRLASGRDGVCDVSVIPLRDETQQVVGLLLLSFEVTELVQAQQKAENALAEVRATQTQMVQMEKMRAVGELASGVAHDLNNALMAIMGYTELAEESLEDVDALQSALNVIKKASSDASSTVRRLQNFARQRTAAHGEPTDVNQVVQDVIQMTRPRWRDEAQKQGRHYEVKTHLADVPTLFAEASGLREVLMNIIHNALDAMPTGGTLTLETRVVESPDPDGRKIQIAVADTGKGMTQEVAARIFDPFFTTRGIEGTGLGLAVSWTIIQRHGGEITVDSTPGQGTRFTLHLPLTALKPAPTAPAVIVETKPLPGARVLVVDDEPFVSSIVASILTRRGHRVTAANDAAEALKRLREPGADFQLLVTDHGMPGMTGLELLAEIRRNGPQIPVVMLTGWGQSLLQNHTSEEMPDALLGKPINQADLLKTITQVLRKAEAPDKPEDEK